MVYLIIIVLYISGFSFAAWRCFFFTLIFQPIRHCICIANPFHDFREIPKCIDGRKLLKQQKKDGHKSREISKSLEKRLSYRNCLLLGINAVTKALESGPLSLVLVSRIILIKIFNNNLFIRMKKSEDCSL